MIVMRRALLAWASTCRRGLAVKVGLFNRVTEANTTVYNWARLFGDDGQPAQWVLDFFHKGGYHGVMWGLIWTACLWLIVLWCNRRELYWKS